MKICHSSIYTLLISPLFPFLPVGEEMRKKINQKKARGRHPDSFSLPSSILSSALLSCSLISSRALFLPESKMNVQEPKIISLPSSSLSSLLAFSLLFAFLWRRELQTVSRSQIWGGTRARGGLPQTPRKKERKRAAVRCEGGLEP